MVSKNRSFKTVQVKVLFVSNPNKPFVSISDSVNNQPDIL
jgi:hypothetical protein